MTNRLATRRPAPDLSHAPNRIRKDVNAVKVLHDPANHVTRLQCYRVSAFSRLMVGNLYARSKARAMEMLALNGFYEAETDYWLRPTIP